MAQLWYILENMVAPPINPKDHVEKKQEGSKLVGRSLQLCAIEVEIT
jgi:hypothetical protein